MRVETQIILFILILNIATLLVTQLGDYGVIAGVAFNKPINATGSYEQYEENFNASSITDPNTGWKAPVGIALLLGDLWGGLQFFFKMFSFVFVGFPYILYTLGDAFITDSVGLLVWHAITGALTAIFGIYMSLYIIQLITGRPMNE